MTLRIIDGFDYVLSTTDDSLWDAMGWSGNLSRMSRNADTAFDYGYALGIGGNTNTIQCFKDLRNRYTAGTNGTLVWGCRMLVPTEFPSMYFEFWDTLSTTVSQWKISFNNTGNIIFFNSSYGTVTTPAWSFFPGRWFYLEVKWLPGLETAGTFEVRVNTVVKMSIPACGTAMGIAPGNDPGVDVLYVRSGGTNSGLHLIDDMYFLDSLGTINNDYLGNVRVKAQFPTGNSSVQWAIGGSAPAATNWQSVLNSTLDETKFVEDSVAGQRDLYTVDANISSPYIYGVELNGIYRQNDATQRVVRNTLQTSLGTNSYGADHYCYGFYVSQPDIIETNPDTGLAFTQSEINSIIIGPEVVS